MQGEYTRLALHNLTDEVQDGSSIGASDKANVAHQKNVAAANVGGLVVCGTCNWFEFVV
jgi:hypothetical protein